MNQNIDMTEMQEQHLNLMIKLAFDFEDAEEVQRILDEPEPDLSEEDVQLTNAIFVEVLNASDQQHRKEKRQQYFDLARRIIPRFVEVAACLILVVAIAAPVALANSAAFRAKVMQLLIEMDAEKEEAHFRFVEDETATFWVPEGWPGAFYPSYIPNGYQVFEFDPFFASIEYRDIHNNQLFFLEHDEYTEMLSGTDNSTVSTININGHSGYIIDGITSDGVTHTITLIWQNDTKWFSITGFGLAKEEAIAVATSVKKIIK